MADKASSPRITLDKPSTTPNSDADKAGMIGEFLNTKYGESTSIKVPRGADSAKMQTTSAPRSIFNDYHVLSLIHGNYPVTDDAQEYAKIKDAITSSNAIDLIKNPQGASIFLPRDFMLCSKYGMPINRMITLRRFPYPVGDNIFETVDGAKMNTAGITEPDIGRMIAYMDQDTNKLSDVMKFSYKMNWSEKNAQTEDASSGVQGEKSGVSGFMKTMAGFMDDGTISKNAAMGSNRLQTNPLLDANKVHGPVDSIAKTFIRDIGLESEFNFNIVFEFELRSLNGMNPKTLFIDLLSNVLACTYNNGRFWGGSRIWTGERPSNWMRKLAFMNPSSAEDFMQKGRVAFKETIKPFAKDPAGAAIDILKNIVMNGLNLALGKILDKVGRPSTMVMNSILNGESTGDWHLTIGNPLNPIISIGNLILQDTEISFGDTLGYDDFPTKMRVECKLKPGKSLDKAGIESIFNRGYGRTYWAPTTIQRQVFTDSINSFGKFDNASASRSAEMQTEFVDPLQTVNGTPQKMDSAAEAKQKGFNKYNDILPPREEPKPQLTQFDSIIFGIGKDNQPGINVKPPKK